MVLNKNLVYFKILSVFMALLMAAFVISQSVVRAEASISLGAIIDAYGIPIVLGLCIGTVIISALAVTGFSAKNIPVEKLGTMIKAFYDTYGESVCQSIYESVQDGSILVHTADPVAGGFWLVLEWVKDFLKLSTINSGGSVSAGSVGTIKSIYASSISGAGLMHDYTFRSGYENTYNLNDVDVSLFLNDFTSPLNLLRTASASFSSGALYITHIVPGGYNGYFGILCKKLDTFWSASVPASKPLYSFQIVVIRANTNNSSYGSLQAGKTLDFDLCSTTGGSGKVYDVQYKTSPMFFLNNLSSVIDYWTENAVSFTPTYSGRVRGIISNNLFFCNAHPTAITSYFGYCLPFQFFQFAVGEFTTMATTQNMIGLCSSATTSGNATYFNGDYTNTDAFQVLAGWKNNTLTFSAYVAEPVSMTIEWINAHPLTGQTQEKKLRDLAGNPGGIAIDLPTLNDTDTVWTIPSAGDIADAIAASPADVVAQFSHPLVSVFEQVAIAVQHFPRFISPFLDIAVGAFPSIMDSSDDVFGIFKFWYDWRAA